MKIELNAMRYPCPCCGFVVFFEPPGSHAVCPVCDWEDDVSQLRYPDLDGGANLLSLIKAQARFLENEGCLAKLKTVELADRTFDRDVRWRPLKKSEIHFFLPQKDPSIDYPIDSTHLYYWRSDFWRPLEV